MKLRISMEKDLLRPKIEVNDEVANDKRILNPIKMAINLIIENE